MLRAVARASVLLLVVVAVAGAILWTRLANGPLPLAFLKGAIAENMSAALPGFTTRFDDVTLVLNDRGFELQIENVRLRDDSDGTLVAVSPTAAISLSTAALWTGTLAAERVELVQPSMRLFYSREAGIALTFSQAQQQRQGAAAGGRAPIRVPTPRIVDANSASPVGRRPSNNGERTVFAPPPAGTGVIDLSRTLHRVVLSGRDGSAAGYLRSFGLRAATLLIDDPEQPARLRVRRVRLDLTPTNGGNTMSGLIDIAEADGGVLRVDAKPASDAATSSLVDVAVNIEDLNPGAMARKVAALRVFAPIDARSNFRTNLKVLPSGDVHSANVTLKFDRGRLMPPGLAGVTVPLDGAAFDIRYDRQRQRFDIGPSVVAWSGHKLGFIGAVTPDTKSRSSVGAKTLFDRWAFTVTGTEGAIVGPPRGLARNRAIDIGAAKVSSARLSDRPQRYPIQAFQAVGHFDMLAKAYVLEQARLAVGGGQIIVSASTGTDSRSQGTVVGSFTGFPREVLLAGWPRGVAETARRVLQDKVLGGAVDRGRFAFGDGTAPSVGSTGLSLTAREVILQATPGLPALTLPQMDLNVSTDGIVSALAEQALIAGASKNSGRLKQLAYVSERAGDAAAGVAEVAFGLDMSAAQLTEILNVPSIRDAIAATGREERFGPEFTGGRATGSLRIALPDNPADGAEAEGLGAVVTGTIKLQNAAFKSKQLPYPVTKADVELRIGERVIDVGGKGHLNGVPVTAAFRHVLEARQQARPPLRLTAALDRAGRRAFGFDLGGVITGVTPVEVRVPEFPRGEQAEVVVDLTRAQLEFSNLGFFKSPGRTARLSFSVVPKPNGEVTLDRVRLTGERLAVEGRATVGTDGELSSFQFPSFSLDLVSRVSLAGKRRKQNGDVPPIWSVTASGPVLNGRGIFRGVTSLGEADSDSASDGGAAEPGLELDAAFETVLGFGEVKLKQAEIRVSKRAGRVVSMTARGRLPDGGELKSGIETLDGQRQLVVRSTNAGDLLRMVNFYPNMRKGTLRLQLALDGAASDIRRGTLNIEKFDLVGDPVVSEVILAAGDPGRPAIAGAKRPGARVIREVLPFDSLTADFRLGYNQLVIEDARATGQVIGGSLRGKADFGQGTINVGGTYSFLQPLNRLPVIIPGLGELLTGPRGEGLLGLNYAVKGPLAQPEVVVHPLSAVVPGIFREFFTLTPQASEVIPRGSPSATGGTARRSGEPAISSPAKIIGDWTPVTRKERQFDPFSER